MSQKEILSSSRTSADGMMSPTIGDEKPTSRPSTTSSSSPSSSASSRDSVVETAPITEYGELGEPEEMLSLKPSRIHGADLSKHATGVSVATNATQDPGFEMDFSEDDIGDPKNWSFLHRSVIIACISFSTLTVVLYSTSYTSGIPGIMETFHLSSETIAVLGITTYLLGLAVGSVVLAPLSEMYGRRPIYLVAMALFAILVLPCALAPSLEAILITRFFGAIAGSSMISNAPGTVNDIVREEYRALAFSVWSIGPMNGPVIGPLVGGFVFQYLGWRWTNWVVMIAAGASFGMLVFVEETYAPAILRSRAAKKRKETGDARWWCRYDEKTAFWNLLKINLSRPFVMLATEPICIFWDVYIAVIYAILYLCFVAYPIIFSQERGWSPGIVGLAYLGIGTGSMLTIILEPFFRRMINAHKKDPVSGKVPPEAMVSVVCIASLCIPAGELIFAWTCTPNVHWIVPIIAGVPFGAGNCAVFIYSSAYLTHSYGIYAASALAGNSVFRSVIGGTLPLAGPKMYETLGPHWAGTLLGLLELSLVPIPFVFYRYGHRIRQKSVLISRMQEDKERLDGRKKRAEERAARLNAAPIKEKGQDGGDVPGRKKEYLQV